MDNSDISFVSPEICKNIGQNKKQYEKITWKSSICWNCIWVCLVILSLLYVINIVHIFFLGLCQREQ